MTTEDRLEHTAKDKCTLSCDKEFSNEIVAVYVVPSICFCDHESTNTFATTVACKSCINVNMGLYTKNKDATCYGAEMPFALCQDCCLRCCNWTTDDNDAWNTVHPSEGVYTCGLSKSIPKTSISRLPAIIPWSIGLAVLI